MANKSHLTRLSTFITIPNQSFTCKSITMLDLFDELIKWRRNKCIVSKDVEFQWTDSHLSIVRDYFSNFSTTCELPLTTDIIDKFGSDKPRSSRNFAEKAASFTHELQQLFMVLRLDEGDTRVKKYQLVEAFIRFLLQLLYHKTESIANSCDNRINDLEKELRFIVTIFGDTSLMLCADEHEEFHKLLSEFEAGANDAGRLVHCLFFSIDRAFGETTNTSIGVVLDHIDLLKSNIIKFLNLLPSISRSAYVTPRTCVVDSLLIVDSLVHDLEDLMEREDNRIADLKDQIGILHQKLILFQSSVKEVGSLLPSEVRELKEPLMRMGDVAREAEYLIISFLVGDAPLWYLITRLADVDQKIELISTELQEITMRYKFRDLKIAEYFSAQLPLQPKSNTKVDDVTVGFEETETYILDRLVGGGTGHLQVISVYGMPGIGKTTLAKKLYNHPLVYHWFDKLSWCVVSQTCQRQSILTDILIHLTSGLGEDSATKMDEESLVEQIYKTLKGRKYLVVVDDIWDSNVWDDLQRCFPDDGNGSRVLFTTRNKDVAPPNSIIYALPSLSNDQCWELLKKKVFNNEPCPPELLGIGKKIAANCYGLPLAVVVIAGILSTMDIEKSKWEEVEGNLASYIFDGGDNSVMQILELSYKHLSEHLKPCFLYFGAFREHQEIPFRKMRRLWIAEGFIHKEEEKSAENVAEEYLMQLIDKSLVMVAKRSSDGGVKTCVIHDLLRELCLKRSEEENFLKFVENDIYSIYEKGHRIQAHEHSVNSSYSQQVRSFRGNRLNSDFYIRDMRLLRVLHFDFVRSRIIGIEHLVYLRYLVTHHLPESIDSLANLEYLRVQTYETVNVPPAIGKMRKLTYLQVSLQAIYDEDWNSSEKNNLEFLSRVVIRKVKDEEMLRCSLHLRKLKCIYELVCQPRYTCPHFDLGFLARLNSLNLTFRYNQGARKLKKFNFPANIKKLTLSGELWLRPSVLSMIGRLKNLEVLKLRFINFKSKKWSTRDGEFQKLKFLKLQGINLLKQWNVASSEHFPLLERLVLCYCYKLQEIPCEIGEISTLQSIEVQGLCPASLEMSAKRIQEEQWNAGNEELRVIISVLK